MARYPLLVTLALLALVWLIDLLLPTPLGIWWFQWLGLTLLLAGGLLLIVAAGVFQARGTTVDPTRDPDLLVTDGLYRLSRNPMYLGMLLALVGFALWRDAWLALLCPLAFFLYMDRVVIPREEQRVAARFAEQFDSYRQRTRRWIGCH